MGSKYRKLYKLLAHIYIKMLKTLDKIVRFLAPKPKERRYRMHNKYASEMTKQDILNLSMEYSQNSIGLDPNIEYEKIFGEDGILKGMDWQEAVKNGAANLAWKGTYDTHDRSWIYHAGGAVSVVHEINKVPTAEDLGLEPRVGRPTDSHIPYKRREPRKRASMSPYIK